MRAVIQDIQDIWIFKHYARHNKVPGGKVVVTSSSAGLYPMESNPIYTAAKHALVGLVRALGPAFAKENNKLTRYAQHLSRLDFVHDCSQGIRYM